MEASMTKRDGRKQLVVSERSHGAEEMEAKADAQKRLDSERSQGVMVGSMTEKDTQKQLKPERSQGDFEELEKRVKCLEEENKKLKEDLIQQEKVMVIVKSDHGEKFNAQKRCMELREESWARERNNFEKQLSELKMKEESWARERNNFEKQLSELKMKEESWEKERSKLQEKYEKIFEENNTNVEQLSKYQQLYNMDKLIAGSPLERFPGLLPLWMSTAVAPKGFISGDELGVLMANLIPITAMVVTYANKDTEVMFPLALLTFFGTAVGSMFNNMVTNISMDPEARFMPTLKKSLNQVPWAFAGAVVPLIAGGFITDWVTRCAVASAASLAVKVTSVVVWKRSYNIKVTAAASIVGFGIVGTFLAAGLPHLFAVILKK